MARTVSDVAILLSVLVGEDKRAATTDENKKGEKDYTKFLDPNCLRGARIGLTRQFVGNNPKQKKVFDAHLEVLESGGASLIEVTFGKLSDERLQILLYELKTNLNKYSPERRSPYKRLADLIKFNEDNKERVMPLFGQELFQRCERRCYRRNGASKVTSAIITIAPTISSRIPYRTIFIKGI
jgi:amidase